MCGIVGVLSKSAVDQALVARMRDTLSHRGPDHGGLFRSEDGAACFGHRRLSIIDLDPRSHQPLVSHDGALVVTFNGEIYNYRALRKQLEKEGARFATESDTEVLLEGYRIWGTELVRHLSGMFAFALWDRAKRTLFCARDRAGEKPFYYAFAGGSFLFGSELKALLEFPGIEKRLDPRALVDFLSFGCVVDPKSIFSGIRKLAPAHAMSVRIGEHGAELDQAPSAYWQLGFGSSARRTVSSEELREVLLRAADEMAVADVPLGTFLSGGVDSSSVTAALSLSGHDVRAFTIGFDDAAYDERPWARQVTARYRLQHVERTVNQDDALTVLDRLAFHYDEPFGDYSSIPTYYLCREARQGITVALSGDGADELFAGYRKYQRLARRAELARLLPPRAAGVFSAIAQRTLREGHHLRRTLKQYGLTAPRMLTDMLCIVLPPELLRTVARGALASELRSYDALTCVSGLLEAAPPEDVGLLDAMRHLDFHLTLPGDMLTKVDRASMAVALEVRPLFLHRDVMELAARIPPAGLADRHSAKLSLKAAVRPWLSDGLIDRKKQGFALPLPGWLSATSPIGARLRSLEEDGPVAELLDLKKLRELAETPGPAAASFTAIVYAAFVLDRWFSHWMPN
jgi:asparagine synthase (glutamine-hydrolysing)